MYGKTKTLQNQIRKWAKVRIQKSHQCDLNGISRYEIVSFWKEGGEKGGINRMKKG